MQADNACSPPVTNPRIDPQRLRTLLGAVGARFDVEALAECDSTNALLLERAAQGAPAGSVIVTDRQREGRGSRGRRWLSSAESGLTFSLLWRFEGGLDRLAGLSLASGVAVVRALAACGVQGARLKWPNDLLYQDSKLGGILVELHRQPSCSLAVIGIGLNLRPPPHADDAGAFSLPPAALSGMCASPPGRHALLAAILIELAEALDRFSLSGFSPFRTLWQAQHAWQNRTVQLFCNGRLDAEGVCLGADADGALLLRTATGVVRCLSGEVSLRLPETVC